MKLIVIAGPSGSGKTTVVQHLIKQHPELSFSISATTREPRKGEMNGNHYYFLSINDFEKKIKDEEFIEYEEVYEGLYYGTLKKEIERILSLNKVPILDIDVIGAVNIKSKLKNEPLFIFIHPGSKDNLERRLRKRGTEDEQSIKTRLKKSEEELAYERNFENVIVNNDLNKTLQQAEELVKKYLLN